MDTPPMGYPHDFYILKIYKSLNIRVHNTSKSVVKGPFKKVNYRFPENR